MYMGVIPSSAGLVLGSISAPHVYGGDPYTVTNIDVAVECSPCIWG